MPIPVEGERQLIPPSAPVSPEQIERVLVGACSSAVQLMVAATLASQPEYAYNVAEVIGELERQRPPGWLPSGAVVGASLLNLVNAGLVAEEEPRHTKSTRPRYYTIASENPAEELAVLGVPLRHIVEGGSLPFGDIFAPPSPFEPDYAPGLRYTILQTLIEGPEGTTMTYADVEASINSELLTEWRLGVVPSVHRLAYAGVVETHYTGHGSSTMRVAEPLEPEVWDMVGDLNAIATDRRAARYAFRRARATVQDPHTVSAVMRRAQEVSAGSQGKRYRWPTQEHILCLLGLQGEASSRTLKLQMNEDGRRIGHTPVVNYLAELTRQGLVVPDVPSGYHATFLLAPEQTP